LAILPRRDPSSAGSARERQAAKHDRPEGFHPILCWHRTGSIFGSLDAASRFFEAGALGYSPARAGGVEAFTLETACWRVRPFAVRSLASSLFDDERRFRAVRLNSTMHW